MADATTAAPATAVVANPDAPDLLSQLVRDNVSVANPTAQGTAKVGDIAGALTQMATAATAAQQLLSSTAATNQMLTALGIKTASEGSAIQTSAAGSASRIEADKVAAQRDITVANQATSQQLGGGLADPNSYLSQQVTKRRAAADAYEADISNYLRKSDMGIVSTLTGQNSVGDLLDAKFFHTKEQDIAHAQAHLQLEASAARNISETQAEFTGELPRNTATAHTLYAGAEADAGILAASAHLSLANEQQMKAIDAGFRGMEMASKINYEQFQIVHAQAQMRLTAASDAAKIALEGKQISLAEQNLRLAQVREKRFEEANMSLEEQHAAVNAGLRALGKPPVDVGVLKTWSTIPQGKMQVMQLMNAGINYGMNLNNPANPTPIVANAAEAAQLEDMFSARLLASAPGSKPLFDEFNRQRNQAVEVVTKAKGGKPGTPAEVYSTLGASMQKLASEQGGNLDNDIFGKTPFKDVIGSNLLKAPEAAQGVAIIKQLAPADGGYVPTGIVLKSLRDSNLPIPAKVAAAKVYMEAAHYSAVMRVQPYKIGLDTTGFIPFTPDAPTSGVWEGRKTVAATVPALTQYFNTEAIKSKRRESANPFTGN